jgi:glycerol-3-phosphate responsive antiterminator
LTRKELVKLEKQQASVTFTKRKAKADGVVTNKERAKIHAKQAHLSKNICVKKNNEITR